MYTHVDISTHIQLRTYITGATAERRKEILHIHAYIHINTFNHVYIYVHNRSIFKHVYIYVHNNKSDCRASQGDSTYTRIYTYKHIQTRIHLRT